MQAEAVEALAASKSWTTSPSSHKKVNRWDSLKKKKTVKQYIETNSNFRATQVTRMSHYIQGTTTL